ncbi:MAG: hypothetical protein ABJB47_15770 [Actinomycetota bacterium]
MQEATLIEEQAEWATTACPAWCETTDHGPGDLEHRTYRDVTCSLHPKEQPTVEAARSKLSAGSEQWFQQNQAMSVALIDPPGAAEPYLEVCGHSDFDDVQPQATRLSLAEGTLLARTLRDLITAAREAAPYA